MPNAPALAVAVLLLSAPASLADPTPPAVSTGSWFDWQQLTGDWGGLRSELEQSGVHLNAHYVSEISGNPVGGYNQGGAYAHEFMVSADLDSRLLGWLGGTFHLQITERAGSSLSKDKIHNILTVQEIYGDGQTVRLTQLSYEQTLFGGAVDVEAGHINTENDFASSPVYFSDPIYCDFQNNAICGTPIAAPVNTPGYVAYPASAWGARVKLYLAHDFYLEGGAYEVNPSILASSNGWKLGTGGAEGVATFMETGITVGDRPGGYLGNYRFGAYYDNSSNPTVTSQISRYVAPDLAAVSNLPAMLRSGRYGGWLLADQLVEQDAGGGIAIFANLQWGDKASAFLNWFGNTGLVRHGTFPGRPDDTLSLGFAIASINGSVGAVLHGLQAEGYRVPGVSQESMIEANYGAEITPWANIRPGLQYVFHPAGTNELRNALVFDVKTVLVF